MTVAVVGLVTVLVFVMLGYQFNRADGKIEQGGLVQFDTKPNGATVTIDGASFGTRTPAKSTLDAGQHFVTMKRDGYHSWQKSVDVVAGSVLWLNYARLIPTEMTPSTVESFTGAASTAVSPDNRWIAVEENASTPVIHLLDISGDSVATTSLTLPKASYTSPTTKKESFTVSAWDPGSRYLLIKHSYDTIKNEWIVLDRSNATAAKNITALLDIDATKLLFSNNDSNTMYAQIDHAIRKIDIKHATLSRPLVSNVAEFSLYDASTLTYVTKPEAKTGQRTVGYYDDGASKSRTIRTYPKGAPSLHLAIGKYYDDPYVSIAYGDTVEILRGTLPRSDSNDTSSLSAVATVAVPGGVSYLSAKTNGRFVVAQQSASFTVYDLELKKMTTTKLSGDTKVSGELRWLDGYSLWSNQDGTIRTYEFDGANQHDIMPATQGTSVSLSANGKYLYGFTTDKNGTVHLVRVQLQLS